MMHRLAQLSGIYSRLLFAAILLSVSVGLAVAFFLWSLDRAIELFWHYDWLIYLLPIAGLASGVVYWKFGKDCEAGNNIIYQEIEQSLELNCLGQSGSSKTETCQTTKASAALSQDKAPDENEVLDLNDPSEVKEALAAKKPDESVLVGVSPRMSLLVLVGTLLTHVCGGSAGREGTAVQMGGSMASWFAVRLKLTGKLRAVLLQAGIAAGFGAVFGTPLAAAIFAIEVIGLRLWRADSLLLAVISAIAADRITRWTGIQHTSFELVSSDVPFDFRVLLSVALAGVGFGLATVLFLFLTSRVKHSLVRSNLHPVLRPAVGGAAIILLTLATGATQYLSLGVKANPSAPNSVCLESSFEQGGAEKLSWLNKLAFTSVTLGSGLKGGEATPLFFMGSTLGHALSSYLALPIPLLAAIGLVAMFSAATRTPLACTMMAVELYHLPLVTTLQLAMLCLLTCSIAVHVRRLCYPDA